MAFIGNTNQTQAFTPATDYFSGNGSTTAFTLSRPVASVNQVQATVNNVVQDPASAYTVSGNTITFTSAPSSGTNNVYVRYTSPITQVNSLTQNPSIVGDATINGVTVGKGGSSVSTNIAMGVSALASNTTGSANTAFGTQSLQTNTTGVQNTAVGYNSSYTNGTGSYNTSIGISSLFSNSSGQQNFAGGYQALYYNTGSYNTAVGSAALQSNTSSNYNTAVGYQAGYSYNTASTNSLNVYLGIQAGYTQTSGTFNTYVGPQSGYYMTTGSKNSILGGYNGNQGGLDIRTASNYIVLSDGDGNPQGYCDSSSGWHFGKGGTGATSDGALILNGTTAVNRGPYISGQGNGASSWFVGSYSQYIGGTNQYLTCLNTGGGVYLNGASATSWTAVSDERQKENLVEITDGAVKVASLRAVVGNYIWDEEKVRRPFLIAQDVQKVLPEAVTEADSKDGGKQLGVAYTDVIPLLVAAIKEQQEIINDLKARIETLEAK